MRRIIAGMLLGALLVMGLDYYKVREVQAQAQSGPIQIQSSIAHASCTVTPNVTTFCFADDGLFVSLTGAAFAQVGQPSVTGVSSISVNGGTAQTGAVALTIPTKATTTVTSTASTSIQ